MTNTKKTNTNNAINEERIKDAIKIMKIEFNYNKTSIACRWAIKKLIQFTQSYLSK